MTSVYPTELLLANVPVALNDFPSPRAPIATVPPTVGTYNDRPLYSTNGWGSIHEWSGTDAAAQEALKQKAVEQTAGLEYGAVLLRPDGSGYLHATPLGVAHEVSSVGQASGISLAACPSNGSLGLVPVDGCRGPAAA